MNMQGRVFMSSCDDPFRKADDLLQQIERNSGTKVILLDIHAEASSEKAALGWYLDGRVTAVLGTHTHVPTADERILPQGTAYQTDVGMSGPYDSVIGVETELVLQRFLTGMPGKFEAAKGNPKLAATLDRVRWDDRAGVLDQAVSAGGVARRNTEILRCAQNDLSRKLGRGDGDRRRAG